MGYFVAYRFTGADPERLSKLLPAVCDAIKAKGEDVYCTYFDEDDFQNNGYGIPEIFKHAFQKIDEMGKLLIVVDGEEKSEGMLIEAGYCLAKGIDLMVAKRSGVKTHLEKLATKSFEYYDIEDLVQKIGEVL